MNNSHTFVHAVGALLCCYSFISTACEFEHVSFDSQFAGGRLDSCQQISANQYELGLVPENTPINNSPWYAFKVTVNAKTPIAINMTVTNGTHRYPPKISTDGKNWLPLEHQMSKESLRFNLPALEQSYWISAQEIITSQDYFDWAKQLVAENTHVPISHQIFGWSEQQRPLFKLEYRSETSKQWLVILGRQHPPEITGAMALLPFSEYLFSRSELAKNFRDKFNILIVPNLNPDGVFAGNWRHNAKGKDLNRDWNNFAQAESRAVDNYLSELVAQGHKIQFAVDFHSTHNDVFYTIPTDFGVEQPYLVENWLTSLDAVTPDFEVVQKPGSKPDSGVFKQYIAEKYNIHGITYEMGDNTDRSQIKAVAKQAAQTMMTSLLAPHQHQQKLSQ